MEDKAAFCALFARSFDQNGLSDLVTPEVVDKFAALTDIMLETNQHMNITAITDIEKVIPLHYADCALTAKLIPQGASVLDVGCGGGFPTLPLAILRPDLSITALDSTDKKVRYVAGAAQALGLTVHTLSGRAEELAAANTGYRERFDVVTSRAVARFHILDELCLPFVKKDGVFICMKASAGHEELAEAETGIVKLGGQVENVEDMTLYVGDKQEARCLITVRKVKYTPGAYPRPFARIKKAPL